MERDAGFLSWLGLVGVIIGMVVAIAGAMVVYESFTGLSAGSTSVLASTAIALEQSAFSSDVAQATLVTTGSAVSGQCGPGSQVLGLSNGTVVVSLVTFADGSNTLFVRQVCASGASTTPTDVDPIGEVPDGVTVAGSVTHDTGSQSNWIATAPDQLISVTFSDPDDQWPVVVSASPQG